MDKLQTAKYDSLTLSHQHLVDNKEIFKDVPIIDVLVAAVANGIYSIFITDQRATQKINGVRDNKLMEKEILVGQTMIISSAISSYADINKDLALKASVKFSRTELLNISGEDLTTKADFVFNKATELGDKLIPYGITNTMLTNFGTLVKDYPETDNEPRKFIAQRSGGKKVLDKLLAETRHIFSDQIDGLVLQFEDSHRSFYEEYLIKRNYVTPSYRKTKAEGTVTNKLTGQPVKGLQVLEESTLVTTATDAEGFYSCKVPVSATVKLTFTADGFKTEHLEISAKRGKVTIANVVIEPL